MRSGFEDADVAEVAVMLSMIEAVTHYEFVGNAEADVGDVDGALAAVGLVEQGGDTDGARLALFQQMDEVGESNAAIHDVFNDEKVGAFD
jgi:hypothetical protein